MMGNNSHHEYFLVNVHFAVQKEKKQLSLKLVLPILSNVGINIVGFFFFNFFLGFMDVVLVEPFCYGGKEFRHLLTS